MNAKTMYLILRGSSNTPRGTVSMYPIGMYDAGRVKRYLLRATFTFCFYRDQFDKQIARERTEARLTDTSMTIDVTEETAVHLVVLFHLWRIAILDRQNKPMGPVEPGDFLEANQEKYEKSFVSFLNDLRGIRKDGKKIEKEEPKTDTEPMNKTIAEGGPVPDKCKICNARTTCNIISKPRV